eukprot:6385882-Pyramimonas_sp.AAC.1
MLALATLCSVWGSEGSADTAVRALTQTQKNLAQEQRRLKSNVAPEEEEVMRHLPFCSHFYLPFSPLTPQGGTASHPVHQ